MKKIVFLATLFLAGCTIHQNSADILTNVGCTKELKQCADGTTVSRVAPNCEFAPCPSGNTSSVTTTSTPTTVTTTLVAPVPDFLSRVTKKKFGTYVTPTNSPITPERFTGYHTGIDAEFTDVSTDVTVMAVTDGDVVYAGRVSGYGGVVGIRHDIDGKKYVAIYGHLNPASLIRVGTHVNSGDKIGILGVGYTPQTDGERKHLHFALVKGTQINFKGYVPVQSELSAWQDPLPLFK